MKLETKFILEVVTTAILAAIIVSLIVVKIQNKEAWSPGTKYICLRDADNDSTDTIKLTIKEIYGNKIIAETSIVPIIVTTKEMILSNCNKI